jgi:hypothetical protein
MKRSTLFVSVLVAGIIILVGMAAADRLPNETPENQVYSMMSGVEAIGSYQGSQSMQWTTGWDPSGGTFYEFDAAEGECYSDDGGFPIEYIDALDQQLKPAGGSVSYQETGEGKYEICSITVPQSMLGSSVVVQDTEVQFLDTYGELGAAVMGTDGTSDVYTTGHGGLHTGILDSHETRSTTAYSEMTQTNGGYISETKSFDPDTRNKALGLFNVESTKTLTYATDANTGSIAQTAESITMDNMAEITYTSDVVACPFGPSETFYYPAFCNVVYAKSMSQGVTSAAMSSSAQTRTVAATADIPAELNYNFDVKPDASSDIGYAMGTFGTEFGVSITEERGLSNDIYAIPSIKNVYTDKATVTGMIAKFTKQYAYKSGFKL